MALEVTSPLDTPFGVTVPSAYWRWVSLAIDVARQSATVTLNAYVSAAAFAGGKEPVGRRAVVLAGADFWAVAAALETPGGPGLSAVVYAYVRSKYPEFAAAADV